MPNAINPLRHLDVFSPEKFGTQRIDVIGAGATGSRITLSLAKLGIENIHVWDFDTVEGHNLANQSYGLAHIGLPKVHALKQVVQEATGCVITTHETRATGDDTFGRVVFLLTDSMDSRREIWRALRLKLATKLLIETRMGADMGRIYSINPANISHVREWEETLFTPSPETGVSACGATTSVGPTAEMVSSFAVWQFIRWWSIQNGAKDELDNEIIVTMRPMLVLNRQFAL